jgi:hypothetical protein
MNNRLLTSEEAKQLDSIVSELAEGERLTAEMLTAFQAYRDARARLVQHLTMTKTVMTECYDSLGKNAYNPRN